MKHPILTVNLAIEQDVVAARRRAFQISELLGFDRQDATRISAAASELARQAFLRARGGRVEFAVEAGDPDALCVAVSDPGPALRQAAFEREEAYAGARRLVDQVELRSDATKGNVVALRRALAAKPDFPRLAKILSEQPASYLEEVRHQNEALVRNVEELRQRQDEMERLNRELEETNRGVVALYAELEEKAQHLRQAGEMKTKFLSHVTHEFRTPLNAIVGLTRLLMVRPGLMEDKEAYRQVHYIQRSALELTEMVNDLLDLAKAEAGRLRMTSTEFSVTDLFAALRGMFRPLLSGEVQLEFEEEPGIPMLVSDESKVAQILRNLISNAVKFTERGKVRVSASYDAGRDVVRYVVQDTGIGIPAEHHARIFEEFTQLENPLQTKARGSGLGLPLSKRLAELLGGRLEMASVLGEGSRFWVALPRDMRARRRMRLLVVDDEDIARYVLRQTLSGDHDVMEAASGAEALEKARGEKPDAMLLDLMMPGMTGLEVISAMREDPELRKLPVAVVTAQPLGEQEIKGLVSEGIVVLKKEKLARAQSLRIEIGPPFRIFLQMPIEAAVPEVAE